MELLTAWTKMDYDQIYSLWALTRLRDDGLTSWQGKSMYTSII